MSKYRVGFFKNLLNSNGHQFKCLQEQIEVDADNPAQATESASKRFETLHRLRDWRGQADTIEVLSADCPSTLVEHRAR